MLTEEQVANFLEGRLQLLGWKSQIEESKLDFLTTLYRRFRKVMYFQNISMVAKDPEERRGPSMEDVIYQAMETSGGVCMHLNFHMKMVLDQLGYDVYPVGAKSLTLDLPDNHVFLMVKTDDAEGTDGEMYLVDVGFPWPINGPINMKQLPCEYRAGGFKIRYEFNVEENIYQRVLIGGDPINKEFDNENEERVDMIFHLTPKSFDDFGDTMQVIFSDANISFFLNTTLLFRYITFEDEDNFEYVCCLGRKITLGTGTTREIHTFETYPEMLPELLKYFPKLDREELLTACEVYQSIH